MIDEPHPRSWVTWKRALEQLDVDPLSPQLHGEAPQAPRETGLEALAVAVARDGDDHLVSAGCQGRHQARQHIAEAAGLGEGRQLRGDVEDAHRQTAMSRR